MDIEQFAIRAAKGNNGGEWATHYTEEQKEYWRQFVRELVGRAVAAERERCAKICDAMEDLNYGDAATACEDCAAAIRKGE